MTFDMMLQRSPRPGRDWDRSLSSRLEESSTYALVSDRMRSRARSYCGLAVKLVGGAGWLSKVWSISSLFNVKV